MIFCLVLVLFWFCKSGNVKFFSSKFLFFYQCLFVCLLIYSFDYPRVVCVCVCLSLCRHGRSLAPAEHLPICFDLKGGEMIATPPPLPPPPTRPLRWNRGRGGELEGSTDAPNRSDIYVTFRGDNDDVWIDVFINRFSPSLSSRPPPGHPLGSSWPSDLNNRFKFGDSMISARSAGNQPHTIAYLIVKCREVGLCWVVM